MDEREIKTRLGFIRLANAVITMSSMAIKDAAILELPALQSKDIKHYTDTLREYANEIDQCFE